jgi:citrate lyase subunit beta/citryl-CoA lyase
VLPHVRSPDDVRAVDALLSSAEDQQGMVQGATVLLPLIETAEAFRLSYEIATASPRVAYMGGATARSGDIARAIGFRWSPEGHETLFLRSWTLMNVRAAGVPFPITGMWSDVQDIEGLQKFANHSRDLGYAGMMVIHPSHISTVNEVFSPSPEEIDYLCRLMAALEEASSEGRGAVNFEGEMVDAAHARTAALELDLARRLGLWTPTA